MIESDAYFYIQKSTPESLSDVERMDIPTARKILETVVALHENLISNPDFKIGLYTLEQVKAAFVVLTEALVDRDEGYRVVASKNNKNITFSLLLLYDIVGVKDKHSKPSSVHLVLENEDRYILENDLKLNPSEGKFNITRFADFRQRKARVVHASGLKDDPDLNTHRYMWRGVRWMAANILQWNETDIVFPEQLDDITLEQVLTLSDKHSATQNTARQLESPYARPHTVDGAASVLESMYAVPSIADVLLTEAHDIQDVIQALEQLRVITREMGVEVGGSIGSKIVRGQTVYFIKSIATGTEHEVRRSDLGNINFHTHPHNPEKMEALLKKSNAHFDMPSQVDILTFFADKNREQEIIIGPFYTIALQKNKLSAYAEAVYETWRDLGNKPELIASLMSTGYGYEALFVYMDFLFITSWEAVSRQQYDMHNWVSFLRKAGVTVTIQEAAHELSEEEKRLRSQLQLQPGVYEALQDETFNNWVTEQRQILVEDYQSRK